MNRIAQTILTSTVAGILCIMGSYADAGVTPYQAEETARLIAALLSTGRVVIDRNQTLIDDPSKGAKGFTPDVFERQVISEFRTRGAGTTPPGSDGSADEFIEIYNNTDQNITIIDAIPGADPTSPTGAGWQIGRASCRERV